MCRPRINKIGFIPVEKKLFGSPSTAHHVYVEIMCMITPYPNNGRLTYAQTKYNTKLSLVRHVIERAFGLLKGKFRRLKNFDVCNLEIANNTISAC